MKTNKSGTSSGSRLREALLFGFLALSIVSAVVIVSCRDDMSILMEPTTTTEPGPMIEKSAASSEFIGMLFKETTEGAVGGIVQVPIGWAMGALGLASASPAYSEQLKKIDDDLQEIIGQLTGIQNELLSINQELKVLDCSEQQTALTTETGRIDHLLHLYQSFVATAADTTATDLARLIPNATLLDWSDQVLAKNDYASQTPMDQILTTVANQLIQPSSGAITACVQAIPKPANTSFDDTDYYDAVSQLTHYYYYYQAQGLMLLTEALHYQAWVAAGSQGSVSVDSVSFVCNAPNANLLCNQAGVAANAVYNALVEQFTTGGAPYTNDDFLMATHDDGTPRLWVKSLENFTQAYGSICTYPLTSGSPCGITAGFHDNNLDLTHIYRGYQAFAYTGYPHFQQLLLFNGWNSGTAGQFLETARGFENMTNKIIITMGSVNIELDQSREKQDFVAFIDTDFEYSFQWGMVLDDAAFNRITSVTSGKKLCYEGLYFENRNWNDWTAASGLPGNRNNFYNLNAHRGNSRDCGKSDYYSFNFSEAPGWLASNRTDRAKQFRWPVGTTALFTDYCKHNRSSKNAGGVWTMCGNDFTAWLEYIVPRPPTCDNPIFPPCSL
jgi:hypothetical protein